MNEKLDEIFDNAVILAKTTTSSLKKERLNK